jgi:hypothetical protein
VESETQTTFATGHLNPSIKAAQSCNWSNIRRRNNPVPLITNSTERINGQECPFSGKEVFRSEGDSPSFASTSVRRGPVDHTLVPRTSNDGALPSTNSRSKLRGIRPIANQKKTTAETVVFFIRENEVLNYPRRRFATQSKAKVPAINA